MAVINVPLSDTFNEWRTKTNQIASGVGDLDLLSGDVVSTVQGIETDVGDLSTLNTSDKSSVVAAINETKRGTLALAIALG